MPCGSCHGAQSPVRPPPPTCGPGMSFFLAQRLRTLPPTHDAARLLTQQRPDARNAGMIETNRNRPTRWFRFPILRHTRWVSWGLMIHPSCTFPLLCNMNPSPRLGFADHGTPWEERHATATRKVALVATHKQKSPRGPWTQKHQHR